jgi:hypothetical protein
MAVRETGCRLGRHSSSHLSSVLSMIEADGASGFHHSGAAIMGRWTELALKVADAKRVGGTPQGERAMAELEPFIVQTARRIHHGQHGTLRKQRALDFIAMAPAQVWAKIEKFEQWYERELSPEARADETKEWFSAWCRVELRYRYLDQGRAQADEQRLQSLSEQGAVPDRTAADPTEPVGGFELGPDEVDRIKAWDALDGVILFSLTHQWDKVPQDLWRHWLDQLGLEEPFPTSEFIQAPKLKKRAVLASSLGVSRDVIYQRWLRLKLRFQDQLAEESRVESA